jgi:hypothetical protein
MEIIFGLLDAVSMGFGILVVIGVVLTLQSVTASNIIKTSKLTFQITTDQSLPWPFCLEYDDSLHGLLVVQTFLKRGVHIKNGKAIKYLPFHKAFIKQ